MREVVVLGAGVVGMTTAYTLARNGFRVKVIDAATAPGEGGASFGNGAQLSYTYTDAMASPSLVANLPKYLLGADPALRLKVSLSPRFMVWGLRFLANATQRSFEKNTIDVLKLAMESRNGFAELAGKIEFDHRSPGKLNLYATDESMHHAEVLSRLKNQHGAGQVLLTPEEAIRKEPALAHYGHSFVGALWAPLDEAGDSRLFCKALQRHLEVEYGVRFMLRTKVDKLVKRGGKLRALVTDAGEFPTDRAVIALGVSAPPIARTVGVRLPIWPVQGYSITIPATCNAPTASVTDTARKTVFCRIGDRLRIAGLADIGPGRAIFKQARFETLLETAKRIFPKAGNYDGEVNSWTGQRPMTPNSQPIVGPSKVGGLFLNCGHGSLGWTLSMATAEKMSEQMGSFS